MIFDTLITGGTVVACERLFAADIGICGERIGAILLPGVAAPTMAGRMVDARGCFVIPGLVDAYASPEPMPAGGDTGEAGPEDSAAARCGVTTTIASFDGARCARLRGLRQRVREHSLAHALVDHAWHVAIAEQAQWGEVPRLIEGGLNSFEWLGGELEAGFVGGPARAAVDAIGAAQGVLIVNGVKAAAPDAWLDRVIAWCDSTRCPVCVRNPGGAEAWERLWRARCRGTPMSAMVSARAMGEGNGATGRGRDAKAGDLVVSSGDGGGSAAADYLGLRRLLLAAATGAGPALTEFVRWCCERPAEVMKLDHRKGSLRPGMDADVVVVDPRGAAGLEPTGEAALVRTVLVRGAAVVDKGVIVASPGQGRLVERAGAV